MVERRRTRLLGERALLVAAAAVLVFAAVRYIGSLRQEERERQVSRMQPATDHATVRSTDTVLIAVHELARLETVSFHMERVIDLKQERKRAFGMLKAEDAILLVAAGDVVAGVDLSKLAPGDLMLQPSERRLQLRLPPAEVLSVTLDDERTYVYSRRTSLLTKPAADLETRARQQALGAIREAALVAGILDRATLTARQTLRALLLSLGYETTFVQHE